MSRHTRRNGDCLLVDSGVDMRNRQIGHPNDRPSGQGRLLDFFEINDQTGTIFACIRRRSASGSRPDESVMHDQAERRPW